MDVVIRMADLYNAPELRNYYCRNECLLGAECVPALEIEELDRLTIKLLSAFRSGEDMKNILLDITEDGKITEDECPQLEKVIEFLNRISIVSAELKLWIEKNLD